MKRISNTLFPALLIAVAISASALFADGQTRSDRRQVRSLLGQLTTKLDDFRNQVEDGLANNAVNRRDEDALRTNLDNLDEQLTNFRTKFNRNRESTNDVSTFLSTARSLDEIVRRTRFQDSTDSDWQNVKTLLDEIGAIYKISPNWTNSRSRSVNDYPNGNFNNGLTGTYRLDFARSEKTDEIARRSIGDSAPNAEEARRDLSEKLQSPERLAIEILGDRAILASTLAPQVTITVDGRDRTETLSDGSTLRIRATLKGQELTVSSVGGDNDYTVIFGSRENGRSLKVTRRITASYLSGAIFAESYYDKTDSIARYNVYDNGASSPSGNTNYPSPPVLGTSRSGDFIVPSGVILTATLNNEVSTKVSQNNDRFSMTVTAPSDYRGAVIEGYISGIDRASKIKGRSTMTFSFERIRLTNGSTYDFAGYLQSVTNEKGEQVKVDTEGTARGGSQTKETVKRGGIGAGLGALIGAVIGGPKGAVIGAVLGGSAGAGSVYVLGNQDLELKTGSSVTVQSSSPNR